MELQCSVPSWNFCNYDGFTHDNRYSKELCRFCQKTKDGHYCLLAEKRLMYDGKFVHKADVCIDLAAGFPTTISEPVAIDPKLMIRETLKIYNKTVADLLKQGYPRALAEKVATEMILQDN